MKRFGIAALLASIVGVLPGCLPDAVKAASCGTVLERAGDGKYLNPYIPVGYSQPGFGEELAYLQSAPEYVTTVQRPPATNPAYNNDYTVLVTGNVDAYRAHVTANLGPDAIHVQLSRHTRAEWDALATEVQAKVQPIGGQAGFGPGWIVVLLPPEGRGLALTLRAQYGDQLSIFVGPKRYPGGPEDRPGLCLVQFGRYAVGAALPKGVTSRVVASPAAVPAGGRVQGYIEITNRSRREIAVIASPAWDQTTLTRGTDAFGVNASGHGIPGSIFTVPAGAAPEGTEVAGDTTYHWVAPGRRVRLAVSASTISAEINGDAFLPPGVYRLRPTVFVDGIERALGTANVTITP
ncbi:MAG: hypothetical protein U0Q22_17495 [Acidimicrobiales bacterium]